MKKTVYKFLLCLMTVMIILSSFTACSDDNEDLQGSIFDSNISMVQNGYPVMIPDITYKQAYNYFFENPQWRGFEADDGSEVVEFSGGCTYYDEDATVYIQFVIDDEESFSMWYASISVGGETIEADEQLFIELVYTPFATYSEDVLDKPLSQDIQDAFAEMYDSLQ